MRLRRLPGATSTAHRKTCRRISGQSENLKGFAHGFAFDRALEKLVFLPAVWPIVLELTNGKPMLASGTLMVDDPDGHTEASPLHCARDDYGFESARYEIHQGRYLLRRLCGVSLPGRCTSR